MIQKLRGTLAIAAVIILFATGPVALAHIVGWNVKAGPCIGSALGAAVIRLIHK